MKKKILVFVLALAIALPSFAGAKNNKKKSSNNANNENNSSFTVSSVTPTEMNNDVATGLTITGSGFSNITTIGVKLGSWEDDSKDTTDDSVLLSNISVPDDSTILATIPAGTHAQDSQDLTVFDSGVTPNAHYTLKDAITIHPSLQVNDADGDNDGIVEVFQSTRSSSKTTFSLTVLGKSFKNKKWLKLKVGNKKAVITRVARSGEDTIIRAKFKYGKLAAGSYNISLTYKNRLKYSVTNRNKVRYRNMWERGTMTVNSGFSVVAAQQSSGSTCTKENSCKFRTPGSEFRCNADTTYNGDNGAFMCACNESCDVAIL
ncbi:MAG TPA: hypothetical protein DEB07_02015 [Candidatus Moranbacteria bacterium]|nr:hypothetical protein [Candidatus Moranbacteria bacterium]